MDANMSLSDFLLFLALSIPAAGLGALLVLAPQLLDDLRKRIKR